MRDGIAVDYERPGIRRPGTRTKQRFVQQHGRGDVHARAAHPGREIDVAEKRLLDETRTGYTKADRLGQLRTMFARPGHQLTVLAEHGNGVYLGTLPQPTEAAEKSGRV